jgi:hypothetical protein
VGKTIKSSGREIGGCKFIIRDFNPYDPDHMDFSTFNGKVYDDLYSSKIMMNSQPALGLHLTDVSPEFIVCLYDFDANLTSDSFIFPEHVEL